jgi:hypothetical protein
MLATAILPKHSKKEFRPDPFDAESNFTPVEFCTLTNARLLQDEHLSGSIGASPANDFIFNAGGSSGGRYQ